MTNKFKKGFTLIEILIGLSITAAIFIIATSLMVNIFSSTTKSRQVQGLEQVKNDLQAELGNTIRWADDISYIGGKLQIDSTIYSLVDGVLQKNGSPITPSDVIITNFNVLKHEVPDPVGAPANSGTGLVGQYFNSANFTELKFTQTDYLIDFNWGGGSPDPLIDDNTFSIRYTGKIEAPVNSGYTFYVRADDGAILWIDGEKVVDNWDTPGNPEKSGSKSLVGGRKYDLRLEYYKNIGNAMLSLSWSYFGQNKQIIPTSRLYPSENAGSIEIRIEMKNRNNSSVVDNMKIVLSPRSGNIGIIE